MSSSPSRRDELVALFSDPDHLPAATRHFGFSLIDLDPEANWVEAWFEARPDFLNPNGSIQGGIVTGFLDEAMSLSAFVAGDLKAAVPTLEMKTSFLRPLMTDRARARGQVVRLGSSVIFTEGWLWNSEGVLCATASATAARRPFGDD
ncbi:MAG: thioesterase [Oceanicaulis sp.]|uniref:PaaI family thioesterase n=1 Tax=unclassified Oceanicaulis TaxID=2632123 RepID=UPI000C48A4BB|nr:MULTISPECIES: PaaI family thioesterase [unclassified Oceanicaulis]MAB68519.1 thioesterase [Oceanicaulis sp.]MBC39785.1 thioesterase [Oceanicaulis sp.]MBG36094.1 thioesterase [Oceanicaulis sp.]HBU63572.1 thioesterase [Oceanicaulis sp.]HCR95453.1 thioesterase [Oceanicaulis sp.]